jgi:hypothetical protein
MVFEFKLFNVFGGKVGNGNLNHEKKYVEWLKSGVEPGAVVSKPPVLLHRDLTFGYGT